MMRINEVFGPTIQGEGPHAGRCCGFLRFAECNLSCSWCDTPYTWKWSEWDRNVESVQVELEEVAEKLLDLKVDTVVLTGGEPMMQQRFFPELFDLTKLLFDVETNGTIAPTDETVEVVDLFVVSPKLAHSGDPEKLRIKQNALSEFALLSKYGAAVFKFVACSISDLEAIESLRVQYEIPKSAIWVLPEGRSRSAHLENLMLLADSVVEYGFNLSTRIHVLAWNDKRGV
jgi:organic radical activating enzyme